MKVLNNTLYILIIRGEQYMIGSIMFNIGGIVGLLFVALIIGVIVWELYKRFKKK